MDEEQPKKKITLNNFFEQIVEIDKVANAALSNSNNLQTQLNSVQVDLKRLIESLQINFDSGVQNVQTQINEVTNVIVDDQRMKRDQIESSEDQVFAEEDRLQKQKKPLLGMGSFDPSKLGMKQMSGDVSEKVKGSLPLIPALALGGAALSMGGDIGKNLVENKGFNLKETFNLKKRIQDSGLLTNPFPNLFKFNKKEEKVEKSEIKNDKISQIKKIKYPVYTGKAVEKEETKKIVPTNISSVTNTNILKEVVNEKVSNDGVPENFDAEEHFKTIQFTVENNEEPTALEKGPLKPFNRFDPENYRNTIEKLVAENGEDKRSEITAAIMKEVEIRKKVLSTPKDYHPLFKPPGGYKKVPTLEEVNAAYEKGVTLDGGVTVIGGETEVVNQESGNGRGGVLVDTDSVKSASSSVVVINLSENNSGQNLNLAYN